MTIEIAFQGATLIAIVGFGSRILWTLSQLQHEHGMMWHDYKKRYGIKDE